jgi:hypothetical protein
MACRSSPTTPASAGEEPSTATRRIRTLMKLQEGGASGGVQG